MSDESIASGDGSDFQIALPIDVAAALSPKYSLQYEMLPAAPGDGLRVALALADNGSLVVSEAPTPDTGGGDIKIYQSRMGFYSGGSFTPFSSATGTGALPDGARQAIYADAGVGGISWMETPSTDLSFSNWRIFVRAPNGSVRLLGYSEEILNDLMPLTIGQAQPTVGATRVYWETPYPRGERGTDGHYSDFGEEIVGAAIDGAGSLVDIAKDAILPTATGPDLYFARVPEIDKTIAAHEYQIRSFAGDGPEHVLVRGQSEGDETVVALGAYASSVVWVVSSATAGTGTMYVLDTHTNRVQPIILNGPFVNLDMSEGRIVWGNGSSVGDAGEYVYTLSDEQLWTLGDQPGYSVDFTAGAFIAWSKIDAPSGEVTFEVSKWVGS